MTVCPPDDYIRHWNLPRYLEEADNSEGQNPKVPCCRILLNQLEFQCSSSLDCSKSQELRAYFKDFIGEVGRLANLPTDYTGPKATIFIFFDLTKYNSYLGRRT